ncbi:uncharacterized protein BCR38DRAFT_467420 [Pseudomassariella vexata]|uniref:Uncharacterized protein n=1 Tax=Pseudomassariella vexata TaxID=1141098 RepID=A0A1Y2DQD3_9PEZI|nr:uncharacterized protein BCR38DRAFT_467420 [Pseudomassariella vexata]ORY61460.1 hypothetical protein BCR38DRAFT_467420 [Pseudomassariella vexata]
MGREDFYKKVLDSEEFKLLDKLANQADATPEGAVQQVADMAMAAHATHSDDVHRGAGFVDYNVSLALLELVQRLEPAKHCKLVDFVSDLQKQTGTDPSTGESLKIQGETLFTDLPSLGYTELETWCEFGGDPRNDPCDPNMKPEQQQRWVKLNAFTAQLTQAAEVQHTSPNEGYNVHPMDKSLRALWTISKALEAEKHPPETLVNTAALQAACMWFVYAADRLWANVQNGRTYPESAGAGSPNPKYAGKGWNGFVRERWDVWEQGLRDANHACTDEGAKKLIEDALTHMEQAMAGK